VNGYLQTTMMKMIPIPKPNLKTIQHHLHLNNLINIEEIGKKEFGLVLEPFFIQMDHSMLEIGKITKNMVMVSFYSQMGGYMQETLNMIKWWIRRC